MNQQQEWTATYRAAGSDSVAAQHVAIKQALRDVPTASVEVISTKQTRTGFTVTVRRVRQQVQED